MVPVRVVVRVCPDAGSGVQVVFPTYSDGTGEYCACRTIRGRVENFKFDAVFDETCETSRLYAECVGELVTRFVDGYNVSVLAYGQTGSGKTFTLGMDGREDGIVTRFLIDLFSRGSFVLASLSLAEIYREEIIDLSSPSSPCDSCAECLKWLREGLRKRSVACTSMNEQSSRSHAIVTLTSVAGAKCMFVDLAGSERQSRANTEGDRFREGIKINYGLFALGKVISALSSSSSSSEQQQHVPYRDSKLTRILQDCLGGNSFTLMIACVRSCAQNVDETLGTLRFASKASVIVNEARRCVRDDDDPRLVKQLEGELAKLKGMVESMKDTITCRHPHWLHDAFRNAIKVSSHGTLPNEIVKRVARKAGGGLGSERSSIQHKPRLHSCGGGGREERARRRIRRSLSSGRSSCVYRTLKQQLVRLNTELRTQRAEERRIQRLEEHRGRVQQELERLSRQKSSYDDEYRRVWSAGRSELERLENDAHRTSDEVKAMIELARTQDETIRTHNQELSVINRKMRLLSSNRRGRRYWTVAAAAPVSDYRLREGGEKGEKLRRWFNCELDLLLRVKRKEEGEDGDEDDNYVRHIVGGTCTALSSLIASRILIKYASCRLVTQMPTNHALAEHVAAMQKRRERIWALLSSSQAHVNWARSLQQRLQPSGRFCPHTTLTLLKEKASVDDLATCTHKLVRILAQSTDRDRSLNNEDDEDDDDEFEEYEFASPPPLTPSP